MFLLSLMWYGLGMDSSTIGLMTILCAILARVPNVGLIGHV